MPITISQSPVAPLTSLVVAGASMAAIPFTFTSQRAVTCVKLHQTEADPSFPISAATIASRSASMVPVAGRLPAARYQ